MTPIVIREMTPAVRSLRPLRDAMRAAQESREQPTPKEPEA